jgi:hypothetical protein
MSEVPADQEQPLLLDIDQAAVRLNVPRNWLRNKVTAQAVPHLRLSAQRGVRFSERHLREIVEILEARSTNRSNAPSQPSELPNGRLRARRRTSTPL